MWSTVSKAFERSIKTPDVKCLLWSINWIITCSVEWFSWTPNSFYKVCYYWLKVYKADYTQFFHES